MQKKNQEWYAQDYYVRDKCSKATNNPYWREPKDICRYKGKLYLRRKTVCELRQLKIIMMNFNQRWARSLYITQEFLLKKD